MSSIRVNWVAIKKIKDAVDPSVTTQLYMIESSRQTEVIAVRGGMEFRAIIYKKTPMTAEEDDFIKSHKKDAIDITSKE